MAEDWPSPHHHEHRPLPRVEDLPAAWEGYDRERVEAAFDAFYRHIAQLDATLRTLESVDVFRRQASDLRVELRALRSAGWSPYPRGYTLTPERSMLGAIPESVPRVALEVIFLVIVAAVVAVAKFTALEIVAVMAGAVLITFLVELIAARERKVETPLPPVVEAPRPAVVAPEPVVAPRPEPAVLAQESTADGEPIEEPVAVVPTTTDQLLPEDAAAEPEEAPVVADDGSGWAAFAEPEGQPLSALDALAAEAEPEREEPAEREPEAAAEAVIEPELQPVAEAEPGEPEREPEGEPEPESEPAADLSEQETGLIARRRRFRRRREAHPAEREEEVVPKHVRVLPATDSAVAEAELPPWERAFDDTQEHRPGA